MAVDQATRQQVADDLWTAERTATAIDRPSDSHAGLDVVDAYEIQHAEEHFGAGHLIGTYRMGARAQDSVVNYEQRSHDHPNLFLLGSGVFPTAGTANPTLTIAALALWASETIRLNLEALPDPHEEGAP